MGSLGILGLGANGITTDNANIKINLITGSLSRPLIQALNDNNANTLLKGNVGGVGTGILYHLNKRPGILSSGSNTISNLKAPDQ